MKKPYLVDVPVRIQIWIRPDCQKRQYEVVRQAKPSILFLISDGGRNSKEWEAINTSRQLYDTGIDWDCTIYKLYEKENNGMYTMGQKARALIWQNVDRCIFLEDDIIPAVSYFRFCAELLEYYKDDLRINAICGVNHLGQYEEPKSDYFFSRTGSIWGVALWKRVADKYEDMEYSRDPYVLQILKENTVKKSRSFYKCIKYYLKNGNLYGHPAGSEYYLEFMIYSQNQLCIVPTKNQISNIGCTENAAHSQLLENLPRGIRKVFNAPVFELEFPLKHAKYVIADEKYDKKRNRIMGNNVPLVKLYRTLETAVLRLRHGQFKKTLRRWIKRTFWGNKSWEN